MRHPDHAWHIGNHLGLGLRHLGKGNGARHNIHLGARGQQVIRMRITSSCHNDMPCLNLRARGECDFRALNCLCGIFDDLGACAHGKTLLGQTETARIDRAARCFPKCRGFRLEGKIGESRGQCVAVKMLGGQIQVSCDVQEGRCEGVPVWSHHHRAAWIKKRKPAFLFQRGVTLDRTSGKKRPIRINRQAACDPAFIMMAAKRRVMRGAVKGLIGPDQDNRGTGLRQISCASRSHQAAPDNGKICFASHGAFPQHKLQCLG